MLSEKSATTEPLSSDSAIAFVFSPLVGSPLTTSAKFAVVSKSPLTDRLNDSLASSRFAIAGKKSGCDALVLVGSAGEPSILIVDDGQIDLQPAPDLVGLDCRITEERLHEQFGTDWQIAAIGPAGERRVRYATISHDGRHAGRGGSGAVLGAKHLKAILIRGSQRTRWARSTELTDYSKSLSERSFGPATAKYRELGTASNLLVFNRLGALPTRNFQQGSFEGADKLSPETLLAAREKTRAYCAACTIGCEHIYAVHDQIHGAEDGVRLEYENLFALGPLCGIDDSNAVLQASKQCDLLGIDTISTGGTIAFAMECVQRGLIDAPWLKFGSAQSLLRAIAQIGQRDGLGDVLAEGSRIMAHNIGQGTLAFAPQVKGLEIPGYEPRALQTMALGFAVGTRGADHNRSGAYEIDFSEQVDRRHVGREAAALAVDTENKAALMDSLILCKFLRGVFGDFYTEASHILNLVTGWDTTPDELQICAKRIVSAKKLFNIRAGWQPTEDTLPDRFLRQELLDDPEARLSEDRLVSLVEAYNRHRGWTPDGYPTEEELSKLGLTDM